LYHRDHLRVVQRVDATGMVIGMRPCEHQWISRGARL
jgi:hypothetical protein